MTLKELADEIMFYMLDSSFIQTFVDTMKKLCGWCSIHKLCIKRAVYKEEAKTLFNQKV